MEEREKRKTEANTKKTIKDQTNFKLRDPTTYHKKNLAVKTNKKVFRATKTPEADRQSPERKSPYNRKSGNLFHIHAMLPLRYVWAIDLPKTVS